MTRAGFVLLVLIGVIGPLAYGSTGTVAGPVVGLLVACALGVGLLSPPEGLIAALARRTGFLAFAVCAIALVQSLPIWSGFPANPIWAGASALIETGRGSISVAAFAPLYALGGVLSPLLAFMAALMIIRNDLVFQQLWISILAISAAIVVVTLGFFWLFPHVLLIAEKRAYFDSFTGPFVSRNTAATYFGTLALMAMALTYGKLRDLTVSRLIDSSRYLNPAELRLRKDTAIYAAATGLFCLALLLTRSRAGVSCFLVAASGFIAWMLIQSHGKRLRLWKAGAAMVTLILFVSLTGQMFLRASQHDVATDPRWCSYAATLEAIGDNLWFGTGLGTFENVFPAYRIESCGISGVWEMAHSIYLEGLLTLGLIFVPLAIAFFWLLLGAYGKGIQRRKRFRHIPVACIAITVLIALHAAVDFSVQILGFSVFSGVVLGSGAAISLRRRSA